MGGIVSLGVSSSVLTGLFSSEILSPSGSTSELAAINSKKLANASGPSFLQIPQKMELLLQNHSFFASFASLAARASFTKLLIT